MALAATGTLLGGLLVGAAPASAADVLTTWISVQPPPGGSIGPKVMDVRAWSTAPRATVQLYQWLNNGNHDNQRWTITKQFTWNGTGVYKLQNVYSHQCLDMSLDTGSGNNGTPVYQYPCDDAATNQLWHWVRVEKGSNWGHLINYDAEMFHGRALCLDATGPSYADLTPLQMWDCNGDNRSNWNQRWNIS
jgi:hypothetical protein